MPTQNATKLREFVLKHLDSMIDSGGGGFDPESPDFDLYAQDYLSFSEQELNMYEKATNEQDRVRHLTNCIANLKRAIDCQLDTFLYAYNLYKMSDKLNLKFENKLGFLKDCGIFRSRSLSRLNTLRNQMEHSYKAPKIEDIQVYHDLVTAFVAVLQRHITATRGSELEMLIIGDDFEGTYATRVGDFGIKYVKDGPAIEAGWYIVADQTHEELRADMDNHEEFAFFFKVLVLLQDLNHVASLRYIRQHLSN